MNRIVKSLVFLAINVGALVCKASEPLLFMGIPIESNNSEFTTQLKSRGFWSDGLLIQDLYYFIYNGEYEGSPAVVYLGKKLNAPDVKSATLEFGRSSVWSEIQSKYFATKELLTQHYGEPEMSKEEGQVNDADNILTMIELDEGNIQYMCRWLLENGDIRLAIKPDKGLTGLIVMTMASSGILK